MVTKMRTLITTILSVSALLVVSCAGSSNLRTEIFPQTGSIEGKCDLILYNAHEDELQIKIAILDISGDEFTIEPFAAKFNYRIIRGLDVDEALVLAEDHLSKADFYDGMELRRVFGPGGNVVAIEGRPVYEPFIYGPLDITDTTYYVPEQGLIKVIVRAIPLKRMGLRDMQQTQ